MEEYNELEKDRILELRNNLQISVAKELNIPLESMTKEDWARFSDVIERAPHILERFASEPEGAVQEFCEELNTETTQ
jgi:hypothetical protein